MGKVLSYNRANRAVAVLCNHQRAVPKTHDKSMATLQAKVDLKKEAVEKAEKEFKSAKKAYKSGGSETSKANLDKKKKAVERAMEQLNKLETQAVVKEENKTIEKVYTKTHRDKFRWAIEMAGPDYEF